MNLFGQSVRPSMLFESPVRPHKSIIGTGVVATPEQAQEVHKFLREWVSKIVTDKIQRWIYEVILFQIEHF